MASFTELRLDYHLALLIYITPLTSIKITNSHSSKTIYKSPFSIKLRIDHHLALFIYIAPLSSLIITYSHSCKSICE